MAVAATPRGDRFLELNRGFPLRPIRSDAEHARAIAAAAALLAKDELDPAERDYLDVLADLIERYEDTAHPLPPISDADMLRHLIESRELTQAKVAAGTGIAEPTISALLAGRRRLNRDHIEALSRYFKISPAVFLPAE